MIRAVVARAARWLARRGVPEPRLDAELLLAHVLRCGRLDLLRRSEENLDRNTRAAFVALLGRRAARVPLAYLVGTREFWGRTFRVSPAVLVPRPETEGLVEEALRILATGAPARVLDVGTGSGVIAVTLALEAAPARVVAIDVEAGALALAAANARALGAQDRIEFLLLDLFEAAAVRGPQGPLPAGAFDLIVSNPPYVADPRDRVDELLYEPEVALLGGGRPFPAVYAALARGAATWLAPGGTLLVEVGAGQAARVAEVLRAEGGFLATRAVRDLSGVERVVLAARDAGPTTGERA